MCLECLLARKLREAVTLYLRGGEGCGPLCQSVVGSTCPQVDDTFNAEFQYWDLFITKPGMNCMPKGSEFIIRSINMLISVTLVKHWLSNAQNLHPLNWFLSDFKVFTALYPAICILKVLIRPTLYYSQLFMTRIPILTKNISKSQSLTTLKTLKCGLSIFLCFIRLFELICVTQVSQTPVSSC